MSGIFNPPRALQVPFNPVGNIAATNVQAMGEELDNEKVAKSGDTINGNLFIETGRFLIGSITAFVTRQGPFNVTPNVQIQSTGADASFLMARFSADGSPGRIFFSKSRGALGAYSAINSGDELGAFSFAGSDNTKMLNGASIVANFEGVLGADYAPTRLKFLTSDGSATPSVELSIGPTGNICAGPTDSEVVIDNARNHVFRRYTVGTKPDASVNAGRGAMITPTSGNERLYTSNGTDWYDGAGVVLA